MRVKTSQLIPGCVLVSDVIGKSSRSLVPKDTTLTDEHILFLQKFLVDAVDVSTKLADGQIYIPIEVEDEEEEFKEQQQIVKDAGFFDLSFKDHYLHVVSSYQKLFSKWKNSIPIDMFKVRKLVIPLLDRIDEIGFNIFTLYRYVTKKDYIFHHSVAVGLMSAYMAKRLGYAQGDFIQVGLAGFLSDSGMAKMNPLILNNENELTSKQKEEIKKHPTFSYQLTKSITTITEEAKLAIIEHHERLDGSGYPLKLKNDQIHSYARIIAVCDKYHAMTCDRLYGEKKSPFSVIKQLQEEQFTRLDPEVVQVFIRSFVNLSSGIKVRLANNQIGKIVFIDEKKPFLPMIQLEDNHTIISLEEHSDQYIKDII